MKKVLVLFSFLLLLCMCSCRPNYKYSNYFAKEVLEACMVSDMEKPTNATNITASSATSITYNTTLESFQNYVSYVYGYLKNKGFVLGSEGEVVSSLFGGMPEYAFYESSCLEDHLYVNYRGSGFQRENYYVFVYGNKDEERKIVDTRKLVLEYTEEKVWMYFEYYEYVLTSYKYNENKGYTLGMLLPWLIDKNTATSIRYEYLEDNQKVSIISNDSKDISSTIHSSYIVRKYSGKVKNEWSYTYLYEMEDGSIKEVQIIDGYLYLDGLYYEKDEHAFDKNKPNYPSSTEYTFIDEEEYCVYKLVDDTLVGTLSLSGITYVETNESYTEKKFEIRRGYINHKNQDIYIYSDTIFKMNNKFYKIISDKNFNSLFIENN